MNPQLEADILAASQPLRVPGSGERRVLSPVAVERLAAAFRVARWEVEATALEADVVPLHYLRNLAESSIGGQVRLLRSRVTVVGDGPVLARALELLAVSGVGRVHVLVSAGLEDVGAHARAEALAIVARNRNASSQVTSGVLSMKGGNPAAALQETDVVAACLADGMEEQLLQFACKLRKLPLMLAGAEDDRGQATTIFPGDPGTALVYKPSHPHLEPNRTGSQVDRKIALVVGAWLAEQVTAHLLGSTNLLRGLLRYADLQNGELTEFPLG